MSNDSPYFRCLDEERFYPFDRVATDMENLEKSGNLKETLESH